MRGKIPAKPLVWLVLAAALGGLAARGFYAKRIYATVYRPDLDGYEQLGDSLYERGELALVPGQPTSTREPGFPLLIAGLYRLSGGRRAWVVLAAQALMSLLIAAMIGTLGRELFGDGVGAAAFAAYMLYPQSIYYSASLYRDTFASFLFTAAVFGAVRAARPRGEGRWLALSGVSAGVLLITATAAGVGGVGACALALLTCGKGRGLRRAALFLLPVLLISGAWTARNWRLQHRLVLGSTNGGLEVYQAMMVEPDDLGTPRQLEFLRDDPFWNSALLLPESERNAALIRRTLEVARERPALYARRVIVRVGKLWRLWPYNRSYDESYRKIFLISLLSDAWMVPLGLLGFVLLRRWREAPAVWLSVLCLTAFYAALHAVIRYRLPVMGFVILSAVAAIAAAGERLSASLRAARARPAA
ncbi:MAG TPA: glycosyltransferase family 39 protein [Elusimicrobiota bacterium]|nr:glycosyltransferase family 39 protein [Elusimicrobiota bacterium]